MKKLSVLIAAIMITTIAMSQETLVKGNLQNGGYGAFITKVGEFNGQPGVFIGGQASWLINQRFGMGGKGYVLVSPYDVSGMENIKMEFGCWGGLLEYTIAPDKLIHVNVNTMIGAGSVRYAVKDYQEDHSDIDYSDDGFFVIEPGVDAELNVHKNIKIGLGLYYRFVSGVNYAELTNKGLSGISGQITLKFGVF